MTTSSRRDFLSIAAAGSALAASGVFSAGALAAPADMPQGGGGGGRYVPPVKFGLGGVPFGNEFEVVSDEDAYKTLEAAWNAGVRYYDVAPIATIAVTGRRPASWRPRKRAGSPPRRFGVSCDAASPYRFSRKASLKERRPPAVQTASWIRHARTRQSTPRSASAST